MGKKLAILCLLAVTACATDPSIDDSEPTSSTEQDLSSNTHAAFNYFVAKGLTKRQSAGIVGNLLQESSMIPTIKQYGGGPGRGIAQWSVGGRWDHSYHDNNVWYTNIKLGKSRWSLSGQLAFIWYELHSVGGYGLTALRGTSTIRGATVDFMRYYEICGTCDESRRVSYATQVYNAYAGTARTIDADDELTDRQIAAESTVEFQGDPDLDPTADTALIDTRIETDVE
jgi:Phage tail lysozyme